VPLLGGGMEIIMKLYGFNDKFITLTNAKDNTYVIYNSYSNKAIALNKKGYDVFNELIELSKTHDGECPYKSEEIISFVGKLNILKILFNNEKDYLAANYTPIYESHKYFKPHKAYLHLTQRCNLNCQYCYNRENIGQYKDLSTSEWIRIIEKLHENGFDYIVFTGGEVTLRKDLLELAKCVHSCNMKLHILTNGTVKLPDELFDFADSIEISIDDIDIQRNDKLRKNSSIFEVYQHIKSYSSGQKKKITIKTVVSKENQDYVEDLRNHLSSIGITNIMFIPCQPYVGNDNPYPTKTLPRPKHKFDAGMVTKCNGCYEVIAINADGKIYPCQALIKKGFQLSDIENSCWIDEINENKITKDFLMDMVTSNECKTCEYKFLCGGPCKAAAFNSEGSIFRGRDNYCDFAKKECNEYLRSITFKEK
jgi:radical SAM protein with 4Fe4S-binding SPASM domain